MDSNTNKNDTYISTIRINNGSLYLFVEANDHLFDREDAAMLTVSIMVRNVWYGMESMHQKLCSNSNSSVSSGYQYYQD